MDSLHRLVSGPLMRGGAGEEEVPGQLPQHREALVLLAPVLEDGSSHEAVAQLGREAAEAHG